MIQTKPFFSIPIRWTNSPDSMNVNPHQSPEPSVSTLNGNQDTGTTGTIKTTWREGKWPKNTGEHGASLCGLKTHQDLKRFMQSIEKQSRNKIQCQRAKKSALLIKNREHHWEFVKMMTEMRSHPVCSLPAMPGGPVLIKVSLHAEETVACQKCKPVSVSLSFSDLGDDWVLNET